MQRFRNYPVQIETVPLGGRTYTLVVPQQTDALLDDPRVVARFEHDEYMPYWATLWPAAVLLADVVAAWPRPPADAEPPAVIDLGCGLGLVGLVAADRGCRVTVADHDEDALAFAVENARRSDLPPPSTLHLDWRDPPAALPQYDRILAADVLYEARNLQPVADLVVRTLRPGGFALLADPHRQTADQFDQLARAGGLNVAVSELSRAADAHRSALSARVFHLAIALASGSGPPPNPPRSQAGDWPRRGGGRRHKR